MQSNNNLVFLPYMALTFVNRLFIKFIKDAYRSLM